MEGIEETDSARERERKRGRERGLLECVYAWENE